MKNIEDDYIYESDIEDLLPKMNFKVYKSIIVMIGITLVCVLIISCITPYPEIISGKTIIDKSGIYAVAYIPPFGTGSVKSGQKAKISIENYPENEYGIVTGTIQKIQNNGEPNTEGLYVVLISLDNGLTTTYGYRLRNDMLLQGNTSIIIRDRKVIELIFGTIKNLFQ